MHAVYSNECIYQGVTLVWVQKSDSPLAKTTIYNMASICRLESKSFEC